MTPEVTAYLDRLGLVGRELPPDLTTLVALHRAHLDALPYENLSTMLGRPPSVAPHDCLTRVSQVGRAGYCLHQNAALEVVLRELGFDVVRRHGHVWTGDGDRSTPTLNHLVLEVDGLATAGNPGGRWWPDVGLGDGLRDPLPLVCGVHVQGPFRYEVTQVRADGWSFRHCPGGSFAGVEVSSAAVDQRAVERAHAELTDADHGAFTRLLVVQRRGERSADTLRGCVWTHLDADGMRETELAGYEEWRAALDELEVSLTDIDDGELRDLHADQWVKHEQWTAGRP